MLLWKKYWKRKFLLILIKENKMADRCTLHKTKLESFKKYLDSQGISYREGKGDYQALQVKTGRHGWQCIYEKNEMPEHYSVQDKLMYLIREFLVDQKKNISKNEEIELCVWGVDGFDFEPGCKNTFETSCGHRFTINEGSTKDNDFSFCPFCGLAIKEVLSDDENDEN